MTLIVYLYGAAYNKKNWRKKFVEEKEIEWSACEW